MRSTALQQARNAFEVLSRLPQHGMGAKLSRTTWSDGCYWTINKVRLSADGKHGSAWGVLTWQGQQQQPATPTRVRGPLKPVWRAVSDTSGTQWQSILAAALRQEQQQATAAASGTAAEGSAAEGEQPAPESAVA
ncbi:hypothetical protein D9Q98_005541 [Chlorella vulgaris]|uniref:Uncharacterized protein n=1 Tax=Chlorella vulgaris TaxID=3077 RepID=A0A9D4TM93_CHLVU|nr:hypothetical protein D9Q98_005541 [Chlorella vulgaris]